MFLCGDWQRTVVGCLCYKYNSKFDLPHLAPHSFLNGTQYEDILIFFAVNIFFVCNVPRVRLVNHNYVYYYLMNYQRSTDLDRTTILSQPLYLRFSFYSFCIVFFLQ